MRELFETPLYKSKFSAELIEKGYLLGANDVFDLFSKYFNRQYSTRKTLGEDAFNELKEWAAILCLDDESFIEIEEMFIDRVDINDLFTPNKRPRIKK